MSDMVFNKMHRNFAVQAQRIKHMELRSLSTSRYKFIYGNGVLKQWKDGGVQRNCGMVVLLLQWYYWNNQTVLSGWNFTTSGCA